MTKKHQYNKFPKEKSVNINCKRQVFNRGIANTWITMYICIETTHTNYIRVKKSSNSIMYNI